GGRRDVATTSERIEAHQAASPAGQPEWLGLSWPEIGGNRRRGRSMSSTKSSSWLRYPLAALLALTLGLVWTSFAMADAGNPILNTMKGTVVPANAGPNDPVTVYVRGQW